MLLDEMRKLVEKPKEAHDLVVTYYNALVPKFSSSGKLPRGYALKPDDAWCAATISACAALAGYHSFPYECSVQRMMDSFGEYYIWDAGNVLLNDLPNHLICYDWNKNGWFDHIGIIEAFNPFDNYITTIEGNFKGSMGRRQISLEYMDEYCKLINLPGWEWSHT